MLVAMLKSAACTRDEFFRSVLRCPLCALNLNCQSHIPVLETLKELMW